MRIVKQVKSGKYLLNFYTDKSIICTCTHGSLYPGNYKNGDAICIHIQRHITKKPNLRQNRALRELVDFTCQKCHKHEEKVGTLQLHRIKRGNQGGLYVPNNILVICKTCHKKIHANEFN